MSFPDKEDVSVTSAGYRYTTGVFESLTSRAASGTFELVFKLWKERETTELRKASAMSIRKHRQI